MSFRLVAITPMRLIKPRWHRRLNPALPETIPITTASFSQNRSASILSRLSNNPKAYKAVKRRGRGPASGLGKTSGRGHKGQKQHGKVPAGFEGGQTPQHIVQGPRGFTNVFTRDITPLPLTRIQSWIAQGRIDPSRPITPLQLISSRCVHGVSDGIKLLKSSRRHDNSLDAQPLLSQPLHIVVSRASAQAIAAVEAAGGTVTTRYYTKDSMRRMLQGRVHPTVSLRTHPDAARAFGVSVTEDGHTLAANASTSESPEATTIGSQAPVPKTRIRTGFPNRLPDPTSRRDLEYYRDISRRGYLSHEVPEGDSPSLYFKTHKQRQRETNEARKERKRRQFVGGPAGAAVQKRTVRPGEKVRIW